jgi:hypothetical protein
MEEFGEHVRLVRQRLHRVTSAVKRPSWSGVTSKRPRVRGHPFGHGMADRATQRALDLSPWFSALRRGVTA